MFRPKHFAGLLLLASIASAQDTRGSILGRVIDPSGAVIPGATVRATNVATNVIGSAQANQTGNYEIPFLIPGTYKVTAEAAGFRNFLRENIELRIGDRLNIEVALRVGDATDSIVVTAETPLLETSSASMGQVIDQRRFADLPIAHGNPYLLMQLSAGVVYTANPGLDRPFEPGHIVGYSIGGTKAMRSEITLDGSPNTMLSRGTSTSISAGYTPPSDIVQEFKVETASFDASIGHTQGGVTSITLKSGTNSPHGTMYYSLLNPVLNANLFFANKNGQEKGHFIYNRWGTSLTGPVVLPKIYDGKDRSFFSYAYEGIHEGRAMGAAYGEGTLTVPTAAEREGDFSQLLKLGSNYQIYDPATRQPAPNGRTVVQPFPGNIVPRNRINPIATNILKYWSLPNAPGTADATNNLIRINDPESITYFNHVGRFDHSFSQEHRMFARVSTYKRLSFLRDWFRNEATGMNSLWHPKSFAVDDVYGLSPTTFLNLRYSFYRLQVTQFPKEESLGFDMKSLGFPAAFAEAAPADVRRFPAINITNYSGTQNNWYDYRHQSHALEANLTTMRGGHTIKFGLDARNWRGFEYNWGNSTTGLLDFSTTWTRGPMDNAASSPRGQGLASMLLGLPTGGRVDRNASYAHQSTLWSFYFQDNYRVTPRLTLNLGLRYELEGPVTERWNRSVRGFDFETSSPLEAAARANYAAAPISELPAGDFRVIGGLTFAGVNGQPAELWSRDMNNLMPRLGFAYTLNAKTVLRGGFGLFYAPLGVHRTGVNQTGFSQATTMTPSNDNGMTFIATLNNPFPDGILEPRGAADGLLTYAGRGISFFAENPKAAFQQRWQIGFQRELPQRVVLEMAYVGNHGGDVEVTREYTYLPSRYLSTSPVRDQANIDYLSAQVANPFYGLLPGTGLSGRTGSRAYLLAAGSYPQFTSMTSTSNDGYTWYHALQARMERRFARGYTLNATYQWSKAMDAASRLNGQDSPLEYVISDQDRPHRLVLSGIWELPFGRGKSFLGNSRGVVEKIAGGWQLQGIFTAQSGPAIGFGNAVFAGDLHHITLPPGQRDVDRWFNVDAGFERNSARQLSYNYRYMSTRFNNIRADGVNAWDLSAIKNTQAWERLTVQFRAEFLNAFNHPNFSPPNTTPASTAFGRVTSQQGYPRRIQLGLKLLF